MLSAQDLLQREEEAWSRCDFCCEKKEIVVAYRANRSFTGPIETDRKDLLVIVNDDGNWGGCAECRELINAKNWKGLFEKALPALMRDYPEGGIDSKVVEQMWRGVFGDQVKI